MQVPAVRAERRERLLMMQAAMLDQPEEDRIECPVTHHFAPGMYGREIFIPATALIMGKIHKHAHLNNISYGKCLVYTEHEGVQEFHAPYSFTSEPGTKRLVLALTDVIWTTYHANPTDTRDLDVIEKAVIAESYAALGMQEDICLGDLSQLRR